MARLTYKLCERIAELRKGRMNWKNIAAAIGVTDRTLRDWRKKGEESESGIYYALRKGIEQAESELYEKAVATVFSDAFEHKTKTTRKRIIDESSGTVRIEEKEEDILPNARMALTVLERLFPEQWQDRRLLQIDWRASATAKGIDPEKLESDFKEFVVQTGLPPEITGENEAEDEDASS